MKVNILFFQDEVPVAHSLIGFATAFDIIYHNLKSARQQKYTEKIIEVTELMYQRSLRMWWGFAFLQNHVFTNYVSILTGALVVRQHHPQALIWIKRVVTELDKSLHLMEGIADGSSDEGVPYATYTSWYGKFVAHSYKFLLGPK